MPLEMFNNEDLGSVESVARHKKSKNKKGKNSDHSQPLKRPHPEENVDCSHSKPTGGKIEKLGSREMKKSKEACAKNLHSDLSSISNKGKISFGSSNPKFHQQRKELPIYKARDQILSSVQANQVTIIVSETGSGKSTQIPQYLLEEGLLNTKEGGVVVTQPRKVACLSLAERVAAEAGCKVGGRVGYSVRFDDRSSPSTLIKYATDGMILRELISDTKLKKYKYIILDEAHERTLRNDILLGHVKSILQDRPDCHVIVMSATLDSQRFSKFFNDAPVIKVSGRGHPVAVLTSQEVQSDYLDSAVQTVLQIHLLTDPKDEENSTGKDILVFLPGQEEIESCATLLKRHLLSPEIHHTMANLQVFPLFAGLPAQQQAQALKPLADKKWRKCILATNIAETSLTIPGIRYIVDTGVAKYRSYRPTTGMETLQVQPISKSGAAQRAGRAGREGPGICYRLYPHSEYLKLPGSDIPEIQRCNLDSSLLTLFASGVNDILKFDFLDRPPLPALQRSLTNLFSLGALDSNMKLAPLGKRMAHFPLDPRFSRVVLASQQFGCTQEVLLILAALSVDNLFYSPQDKREEAAEARRHFINPQSDHLTFLTVMREYAKEKTDPKAWCSAHFINHRSISQAQDIVNQLRQLCRQVQLDPEMTTSDEDAILKCVLQGCFLNTALLMPDGRYRTVESNQEVRVHPSSVMSGRKVEAVVFNELVETSHPYLRGVSSVQRSWIAEAAPHTLAKRSLD